MSTQFSTLSVLFLVSALFLAGCGEPIATNSAPVETNACTRCPEWFAAPDSVDMGDMCLQSSRLAVDVLTCAYDLGDCSDMLHDEPPNPECAAALLDVCGAPLDFCDADAP